MCNMLDPSVIILSGSVAEGGKYWHEALEAAFKLQAMPPVQATPLVKGTLGGEAPLIGAAENLVLPGSTGKFLADLSCRKDRYL